MQEGVRGDGAQPFPLDRGPLRQIGPVQDEGARHVRVEDRRAGRRGGGEAERRFATPLVQLYGMTETVIPPTINPLYGPRNPLSIGRPLPRSRLRIVDAGGADVPVGEASQLLVGGDPGQTLMTGYLDDPEATAAALSDGWLRTGDVVRADADGFLHFVDRAKDMIKRSGENVACGEIERVVDQVEGVLESAAVGVPDAMLDEAIHVYIVQREGAHLDPADVIAHCRRELAKYRWPLTSLYANPSPFAISGRLPSTRSSAKPQKFQ